MWVWGCRGGGELHHQPYKTDVLCTATPLCAALSLFRTWLHQLMLDHCSTLLLLCVLHIEVFPIFSRKSSSTCDSSSSQMLHQPQLVKKGASEYGDTWRYRSPEADVDSAGGPAWSDQEKKLKEDFGKKLRFAAPLIHLLVPFVCCNYRLLCVAVVVHEGWHKPRQSVSTYAMLA